MPDEIPPVEAPKTETLFAGKYKSPEELEKGFREIRKTNSDKFGIEPLSEAAVLTGDKGVFKDHAALEAAYKAQERLAGMGTREAKSEPKPDAKSVPNQPEIKIESRSGNTDPPDSDEDVPTLVSKAGLKMDDLEKQFIEKGDLTDEQYAAIRKARPSLSKSDIKFIANGMVAQAKLGQQIKSQTYQEAVKTAGGETQLKTLLHEDTLKQFYSPEEIADLSRRVTNPALAIGAIKDIMARHSAHVGSGGNVIKGDSIPSSGPATSREEYVKLCNLAARGDASAESRVKATSLEQINNWMY